MKFHIVTFLILFTGNSWAQNGYVKLDTDSTLVGYLRPFISLKDGQSGIEYWRTKNDASPLKIPKQAIVAYAIKKDTFKVLHQFQPFQDADLYFELVDAKLKEGGKVNLYVVSNYQNENGVSASIGGGLIPGLIDGTLGKHKYTYLYVLEDRETGVFRAVHAETNKIIEALMDFFPEKYITKYIEAKGQIKYKSIPDLVMLYNSR